MIANNDAYAYARAPYALSPVLSTYSCLLLLLLCACATEYVNARGRVALMLNELARFAFGRALRVRGHRLKIVLASVAMCSLRARVRR